MLKITVLGTGISEDPDRVNTAYLIEHNDRMIQVDAGYNVFGSLCKEIRGIEALKTKPDMILLTHQHGDHMASLSQEILSTWRVCQDADAARNLYITGEPNAIASIKTKNEIDYPGFFENLYKKRVTFDLRPFEDQTYNGMKISHAETEHSAPNYAYRFDTPDGSFAISGDGKLTDATKKLFEGAKILFHDGFNVEKTHPSHATVKELVEYSKNAGIKYLWVVHMDPFERKKTELIQHYIEEAKSSGINLGLPNDGTFMKNRS